jgi:hypothetical protein
MFYYFNHDNASSSKMRALWKGTQYNESILCMVCLFAAMSARKAPEITGKAVINFLC